MSSAPLDWDRIREQHAEVGDSVIDAGGTGGDIWLVGNHAKATLDPRYVVRIMHAGGDLEGEALWLLLRRAGYRVPRLAPDAAYYVEGELRYVGIPIRMLPARQEDP